MPVIAEWRSHLPRHRAPPAQLATTDRHELDGQYLAEKTCKDAITIETRPLVAVGQRVNTRSREGRTQHQSQVMGVARTTLRKFQRDAERRKRSLRLDRQWTSNPGLLVMQNIVGRIMHHFGKLTDTSK